MFLFSFEAWANQCREFFSFATIRVEAFPINKIFAGQNSVGFEYAFFKALRDTGLDVKKDWKTLTAKEKNKLISSLLLELSYSVPVIIDPGGRVFAVDQHHDMFALLAVLGKRANPKVPINILRDFSKDNISIVEFKQIVKRNGWIYERNLDEVLDKPISIQDLANSVERSVVGMAFAEIALLENIPLKGKFFSPFIQFLLADFIQANNYMTFNSKYSRDDVERVVALISKNKVVRHFLVGHLIEEAPRDLQKFFED